jgi:guanylate kinase
VEVKLPEKMGRLFVVSGASGTGKTTLCRYLIEDLGLFFSVSATTRQKRPGEREGRDYFFLTPEEFSRRVEEGKFLEWAQVHEHRYGTPKDPVMDHLHRGESVLLDLDTQGALQLKKAMPAAILIFLKPPSLEALEERLRSRGTETAEAIGKRLQRASQELSESGKYDCVIVNENLEQAKQSLKTLIQGILGNQRSSG